MSGINQPEPWKISKFNQSETWKISKFNTHPTLSMESTEPSWPQSWLLKLRLAQLVPACFLLFSYTASSVNIVKFYSKLGQANCVYGSNNKKASWCSTDLSNVCNMGRAKYVPLKQQNVCTQILFGDKTDCSLCCVCKGI